MMRFSTAAVFALLLLAPADAQRADPAQLKAAVAANSLIGEGKQAFHLKIAFTMFDLAGKQSESGTVEEWWASRGASRVIIASPSLNVTFPKGEGTDSQGVDGPALSRERYFVNLLVMALTHPLPEPEFSSAATRQVTRTFGKVRLTCFVSEALGASLTHIPPTNYCVNPGTNALRAEFQDDALSVIRNSPGTFHDTNVALDIQIAYQQQMSITGKVLVLQSFDPSKSEVVLSKPESPRSDADESEDDAGAIKPGKIVSQPRIDYPPLAAAAHLSGTVVLRGLVTKEGKVTRLFPLVTPSSLLSDAAMDAVSQWRLEPFTRNGKPITVQTNFVANFVNPDHNPIQPPAQTPSR